MHSFNKKNNKYNKYNSLIISHFIVFLVFLVFTLLFVVELLVGGLAAAVEDVDDDGGADQGGDAVDGHGTLKAWGAGYQVTDQCQCGSG